MAKKFYKLERDNIRVIKGPITVTSEDGKFNTRWNLPRGTGKVIIMLDNVPLKDMEQHITKLLEETTLGYRE